MDDPGILDTIEAYYDLAPRASATVTEAGRLSVFLKADPAGFDYYARPRLGLDEDVTPADADAARACQREHGAAERLEWVHETTPSLLAAARAAGLRVTRAGLRAVAVA